MLTITFISLIKHKEELGILEYTQRQLQGMTLKLFVLHVLYTTDLVLLTQATNLSILLDFFSLTFISLS